MQEQVKKILIPIDGSESSQKALEMAISMTEVTKANLTVLEVIEDFGPLPGYYENAPAGESRVEWISEQRFEKVHPPLEKSKINWQRKVVKGYPAEKICEVAEEGAYDLIIIGSRGLSAVGRFFLGSVSDRVIHHAPCSVLVVK
ncbi:MAG: universal stress protein [Spirochaetota bacterium]